MYQLRGIIQTLHICDIQEYVLIDIFTPEESINRICPILYTGWDALHTKNNVAKLAKFASTVEHCASSDVIKKQIINVCKTPYIMSFEDYKWLHLLVYSSNEKEKYVNFAYQSLNTFLTNLENACSSDLKDALYIAKKYIT
jgi:hypothetical protein